MLIPIYEKASDGGGARTALRAKNRQATQDVELTLDGYVEADKGSPGNTRESLNEFLDKSNGPIAGALVGEPGERNPLVQFGDDGSFAVNRENVRARAAQFVRESQDFEMPKDYLIKLGRERAKESGVDLSEREAEDVYNAEYATKAKAILAAARIGDVKLSEPQMRRLKDAERGRMLDMQYGSPDRERGSLVNAAVRQRKPGGYARTAEARAIQQQKRKEFLEYVRGIDF
jgi:hypothetical protein